PRVLLFQYPQSARLLHLHPAVLVLPMVVGRFADVVPRTNRLDRLAFGFLQNPDLLFLTKPTLLHFRSAFFFAQNSTFATSSFSGSGHRPLVISKEVQCGTSAFMVLREEYNYSLPVQRPPSHGDKFIYIDYVN